MNRGEDELKRVSAILSGNAVKVRRIGSRIKNSAADLASISGAAVLLATLIGAGPAMADVYPPMAPPLNGLTTKGPPSDDPSVDRQEVKARVQRAYDAVVTEAVGRMKGDVPVYFLWGKGELTGHVVGVNQVFVAVTPSKVTGERAIYVHPMSHISKRARISAGDAVVMYVDDESRTELYRGLQAPTLVERLKNQVSGAADAAVTPSTQRVDELVQEWKREREAGAVLGESAPTASEKSSGRKQRI